MNYNLFNILILFGCFQGFLLSFLLIRHNKANRTSNKYLAALILAVSLSNLKMAMIDIGTTQLYPITKYIPIIWPFLMPTLLYFFVQHLSHVNYKIKGKLKWLFIPFIINITFQIVLFLAHLIKPKLLAAWSSEIILLNQIKEFLAMAFCLVILLVIVRHLQDFHKKLLDNYAELSGKSLAWLNNLIKAILVLWLFWAIPYAMVQFGQRPFTHILYPFWIGLSVLIYWIGYSAFTRQNIFEVVDFKEKSSPQEDLKISDTIEKHYQKINEFLIDEQLYTNPNLDMTMLAEKMNLSNGYLSQIINQKTGKNFFNFINQLRVDAVKEKLKNPAFDHYSVLGVALESGFNSKSTFNAVFKKLTGKTPSSYRKS